MKLYLEIYTVCAWFLVFLTLAFHLRGRKDLLLARVSRYGTIPLMLSMAGWYAWLLHDYLVLPDSDPFAWTLSVPLVLAVILYLYVTLRLWAAVRDGNSEKATLHRLRGGK